MTLIQVVSRADFEKHYNLQLWFAKEMFTIVYCHIIGYYFKIELSQSLTGWICILLPVHTWTISPLRYAETAIVGFCMRKQTKDGQDQALILEVVPVCVT